LYDEKVKPRGGFLEWGERSEEDPWKFGRGWVSVREAVGAREGGTRTNPRFYLRLWNRRGFEGGF